MNSRWLLFERSHRSHWFTCAAIVVWEEEGEGRRMFAHVALSYEKLLFTWIFIK